MSEEDVLNLLDVLDITNTIELTIEELMLASGFLVATILDIPKNKIDSIKFLKKFKKDHVSILSIFMKGIENIEDSLEKCQNI